MTIGIFVNELKDIGLTIANKIAGAVASRGGKAVIADGNAPASDKLIGCDVIICVGGDGTLIKAARETLGFGAPLLGVNMGSLGYLTEVEISQIDAILDRVFAKDYRVEERMMLKITKSGAESADGVREETVLNELYIGRGDSPHVVRLKLFIGGSFFDVYSGDGILISTPTGSTAYALSAGGPVIDPELSVISIVPVCPHVIFSRPLLVSPEKEIKIIPAYADGAFKASIAADGFNSPDLLEGETISVQKSEFVTKILRFNADNFYVVLKNKLFQTSSKFGPGTGLGRAPANGEFS